MANQMSCGIALILMNIVQDLEASALFWMLCGIGWAKSLSWHVGNQPPVFAT